MISEELTLNRWMKLTPVHLVEYNFKIKRVIFNEPATIVIWDDGTKTVVKCSARDVFDEEKGIALCYMKRVLGNKGSYNKVFKRWIKPQEEIDISNIDILNGVREVVEAAAKTISQLYTFNANLTGEKSDGKEQSENGSEADRYDETGVDA